MTKKDRIATAITAVYALLNIFVLAETGEPGLFVLLFVPIVIYWGYRFSKGDISFLSQGK